MLFQAYGGFDLVDIEGVGVHAGHGRTDELAPRRQHQAVVTQFAWLPRLVGIADDLCLFIDAIGLALDEADAYRIEQLVQRRIHPVNVRLVEAWAYPQLRLGRQQGDFHVLTIVFVQQAGGAQGAPDSSESSTDNQNIFHGLLLRRG
ncbi:hypothetical protein D9M68_738120 [compost metagenome]